MARDSSNPPLLVRSERGTPMWMSPLEVMKLSIGLADFTCCQRNHVITTETQKVMNGGEVKKIPCDKPIAGGILEQLIDAKINHLFHAEGDMVMARMHVAFKHWWMRGLKKKEKIVADETMTAVQKFKKRLRWDAGETWFDRDGLGLLMYAVVANEYHVVSELLQMLKGDFKGNEYTRRLESRIRDEGYVSLGVPGGTTTLLAAMMTASTQVISILLEYGVNIQSVDMMGIDSVMYASTYGRAENIKLWLSKYPAWKLYRGTTVNGSTALHCAVYFAQSKLRTVQFLVESGADLFVRNDGGASIVMNIANNEDSDPSVLRYILHVLKTVYSDECLVDELNHRRQVKTFKWRTIYSAAKVLHRSKLSKSILIKKLAQEIGTTALNYAVFRGDIEIVKILLEHGADPYVENDLGMNAFEICDRVGPFPSVRNVLEEYGGR